MCLAVYPDFKIKIIEEPIFVYKSGYITSSSFITPYQNYKYVPQELNICSNPFEIMEREDLEDFIVYDEMEMAALINEFNFRSPSTMWIKGMFQLITTGFHFMYSEKRMQSYYKFGKFMIPKGARVITGIDEDLGVTDKIIYYGT